MIEDNTYTPPSTPQKELTTKPSSDDIKARYQDVQQIVMAFHTLAHGFKPTTVVGAIGVFGAHLADATGIPRDILVDAILAAPRMRPPIDRAMDQMVRAGDDAQAFMPAKDAITKIDEMNEGQMIPVKLVVQHRSKGKRRRGKRG